MIILNLSLIIIIMIELPSLELLSPRAGGKAKKHIDIDIDKVYYI